MTKQKTIINRELSWLSFNERVLQEAADPTVPVAERIKFLGIFSNNLDEFFKVRVATIKRMIDLNMESRKTLGEKPKKVLVRIQSTVITLQKKFQETYHEILGELAKENVFIINETQLSEEQQAFVKEYFEDKVLPALSPIMLNNLNYPPYLKDKSIYLATRLSRKSNPKKFEYALIEIPTAVLSRFLVLPGDKDKKHVILLDDVIRFNLQEVFSIFPYDTHEAYTIKLTRDAELDIDNDVTKSFLEKISKGVTGRKKGQPVRFVYDKHIPASMLEDLIEALELDDDDNLIPGGRYHNFKDFMNFPKIGKPHMEYPPTPPVAHKDFLPGKSILKLIEQKDILLHVPYQKFSHFINMLREAAIDPRVTDIKITLYRVASNSKVINALINAARNGKKVTVVIELQARFDEKANIYWSRKLEEVGARILFGIPGLKVHSKLVLISTREKNRVHHYAAISTGNFHEGNAAVYTDVTLLTADRRLTSEVFKVFDFFENTFKSYNYKHLLVSPLYMRRRLTALIEKEIKHAKMGLEAYIILKINNLVDQDMIRKLYQASQAGVKVKLIVRGTCALIPGVPGMSENIEAISIVDKFLEHSRIFIFCNKGDEQYYLSSADWMARNLDNRIEVATPLYDPEIKATMRNIINTQLNDNVKARIINEEQDNQYVTRAGSEEAVQCQVVLYNYYKKLSEKTTEKKEETILSGKPLVVEG